VTVPRLHEHLNRFVERNTFLHASLGMLAVGARFEAFCEELTRDVKPAPMARALSSPAEVYTVLGALSLARKLREVFSGFAREGARAAEPRTERAARHLHVPRRVLR
jgi:hypothetical protein